MGLALGQHRSPPGPCWGYILLREALLSISGARGPLMGSPKLLHGWGSQILPQRGAHPHSLPEFAQVWGFSTVLLCCGVF